MKFATVLAATASANVTSYIAENWWNEAVNVFNFAQANWGQSQPPPTLSQTANGSHSGASATPTVMPPSQLMSWPLVPQLLPTTSVCLTTLNNSCTISASNTGILLMLTRAAPSTTTSTSTPWLPLPPSTLASSWAPLTVTTTVSSPDPS